MKKAIAAFLCAAVCLTVGCSKSEASSGAKPSSSEPTVAASEYRRGEWSGNTYTSDFFGYSVTVDGGWNRETDAELAEKSGISDMNAATISKALDNEKIIFEVFAQGEASLAISTVKSEGMTMSGFIEMNIDEMNESHDYYKDISAAKITVAGKEQDCIYATYTGEGARVYQVLVFYRNGDYFGGVTLGALTQSDLQTMVDTVFKSA